MVVMINMLVDYPLVLGFWLPVLIPLSTFSMGQAAALLHWTPGLGADELSDWPRISSAYMWVSCALGLGINTWFFIACDLQGKYVVAAVAPVMLLCGAWLSNAWASRYLGSFQLKQLAELTPRLLSDGMQEQLCLDARVTIELEHDVNTSLDGNKRAGDRKK